jgi:hypothetical protein
LYSTHSDDPNRWRGEEGEGLICRDKERDVITFTEIMLYLLVINRYEVGGGVGEISVHT